MTENYDGFYFLPGKGDDEMAIRDIANVFENASLFPFSRFPVASANHTKLFPAGSFSK